jgi:hypothetical protein
MVIANRACFAILSTVPFIFFLDPGQWADSKNDVMPP